MEQVSTMGIDLAKRSFQVRQRTQTINALRGHLAEFGIVAPQGPAHVGKLALAIEDVGSGLPGDGLVIHVLADRLVDMSGLLYGLSARNRRSRPRPRCGGRVPHIRQAPRAPGGRRSRHGRHE